MLKLEFVSPPNGETVTNPQLTWLKNLVFNKGRTYRNAGAGQGGITREEDGKKLDLTITMDPKFEFYLQFRIPNEASYDSIGNGNFEESITVYVGGRSVGTSDCFLRYQSRLGLQWRSFAKRANERTRLTGRTIPK